MHNLQRLIKNYGGSVEGVGGWCWELNLKKENNIELNLSSFKDGMKGNKGM